MIRGTEPKFVFTLPCNFLNVESVDIIFRQDENTGISPYGALPIIKTLQDCEQGDKPNELWVKLTRLETLRFNHNRKAYTQLTGITTTGEPIACKEWVITVYPIHNSSILNQILPPADDDGWVYLDGQMTDNDNSYVYLDGQIIE